MPSFLKKAALKFQHGSLSIPRMGLTLSVVILLQSVPLLEIHASRSLLLESTVLLLDLSRD